nr:hypothetical protein [Brachymonas sp.]
AQKAASVSARAFGGVVGMLGGPVGVAITALTALAAAFFSAQRAAEQAALVKLSVDRAAAGKAENEDIARIRGQLSQLKQERDELLVERKTGILAGIFSDRQIGIASELKTKEADIKRLDAVLKTAEQTAQSAADAAGNGLTLTVEGARQAFNKTLEGVNTKSSILDDFNKKLQASRDAYKALVATGADESALADARARMAEYESALATERDKALKNLTAGTAQAGAAMAQANKLAVEDVQRSAAAMLGSYEDADAVLSAMRSAGLIGEQEYFQTKIGYLQDEAKIRIQALKDENTLLASQAQGKAKSLEAESQIAKNRAEIARIEQQALTKTTVLTVEAAAKRNQEAQAVEEQVAKLREEVQARELATAGNISQAQALEQLRIARLEEALALAQAKPGNEEEIAAIKREIAARKELLQVMDGDAARLANAKAAEEAAKDWERTSKTIGDTLADYIMGGGKNAAQYLKRLFSTLVLQPVVQTVVGSVFGLGGAGAAAGQVGQLGQLGNLASGFNNLVSAFGKGAAGAASSVIGKAVPWLYDAGFKSVAQGLGAFQAGMASQQSIAAFTSSLKAGGAQMAGALAGAVMNGFAGYGISKLISGGYEVNKYVNKIAGVASAIPGVGLIAGAIGGAINRLFGRKLKDTGIEGTFGGEAGFVGNTYEYYKGGLFRSDKTKRNPLDEATRKEFADYYAGMVFNTQSLGSVLGLDSSGLNNFSSGIKLSLKGLKPEEQEAKINEEFARIQNELAQQVIGTMVTQASKTEASALYAQWTASGLANRLYSDRSIDNPTAHLDDADRQLLEKVSGFLNISTSGGSAFWGGQIGSRLAQQAAAPDTYIPSEYALADEKAIDTLTRLATSLTTVNAVLEELNHTLYAGSLAGADMAYKLSELFGGMEGFTAATSSFYQNFFTADEQRSKLQAKLSEAFSAVDLTLPDIDSSNAREQYRKLAEAQDLATESGREAWAVIMQLGDAFASITPTMEEAAQAIAQQWMDLENRVLAVQDKFRTPEQRLNAQYDSIAGGLIGAGLSTMQQPELSSMLMQSSKDEIYALAQEVWSLGHLSIEARNALLDAADALADLKDAARQQRDGLMSTLWQMTGNTQALREKELAALDPANRALQAMIYALGDLQNAAAEAAQKTQQAWSSWSTASGLALQYTGDSSGLRAQEAILRAQLSSAGVVDTGKLQELIGIEQSLFNAQKQQQAEAQRLQAQITQERLSGLRDELAAARALADAAKRLGDYAHDLFSSSASGLSESDRMSALAAEYGTLKDSARAGNVDAFGRLQSVTGDYLGLASTLATSGSDYSITAGRMAAELEALAKAQELVGQAQATGIEAQMEQLTAQTQIAQEQFEVSSIAKALIAKSMQEQADIWDRENTQRENLLALQERAALSLSTMHLDFGKAMSPLLAGAASNIERPISARLDVLIGALSPANTGSASVRVPAYAVGTNVVPRDMLAQIHEGEAIIPKAFNPWAGGTGIAGGAVQGDTNALLAEIRALREQSARLEARLQGIERSSQQLADQFDNVTAGGNAMATEVMA